MLWAETASLIGLQAVVKAQPGMIATDLQLVVRRAGLLRVSVHGAKGEPLSGVPVTLGLGQALGVPGTHVAQTDGSGIVAFRAFGPAQVVAHMGDGLSRGTAKYVQPGETATAEIALPSKLREIGVSLVASTQVDVPVSAALKTGSDLSRFLLRVDGTSVKRSVDASYVGPVELHVFIGTSTWRFVWPSLATALTGDRLDVRVGDVADHALLFSPPGPGPGVPSIELNLIASDPPLHATVRTDLEGIAKICLPAGSYGVFRGTRHVTDVVLGPPVTPPIRVLLPPTGVIRGAFAARSGCWKPESWSIRARRVDTQTPTDGGRQIPQEVTRSAEGAVWAVSVPWDQGTRAALRPMFKGWPLGPEVEVIVGDQQVLLESDSRRPADVRLRPSVGGRWHVIGSIYLERVGSLATDSDRGSATPGVEAPFSRIATIDDLTGEAYFKSVPDGTYQVWYTGGYDSNVRLRSPKALDIADRDVSIVIEFP